MADLSRVAPEGDTPVNPYSLLEAVNNSSETANTGWLIFLGIMTYFMIAVAGVTHRDLLLETPVSLPILQVQIPITQFFQFAPPILVLFHIGVISQLVLLARKTLEFDHAIRLLEPGERRSHPLRLELHNFYFVQAIAGPHRSKVMSGFLHGMAWLTLVVIPVVLLLYIQIVFLPYHDLAITWSHRAALIVDVAMLALIGVFLMRAETSFFQAFWRTTFSNPLSFIFTGLVLVVALAFSFVAATVPGEALDRLGQTVFGADRLEQSYRDRRRAGGFALPFVTVRADGSLFGIFRRNLVVTDTDLVSDKDVTPGEPTLNLRGRDLRYAVLDRSDLHQADITGANLDHASLVGSDLRGAWLQCADLNELLLTDDRDRASCTSAEHTNLSRAVLTGGHMTGIDLDGARLEEARLEGVEMPYSSLAGANFASARMDKADLTGGVQAQGANFLIASMQGADLTGAQLQFADFTAAAMQGAVLNHGHLEAAVMRDADMEAVSMQNAKLQGADLTGARIAGADMRMAAIWMTEPPLEDRLGMADLSDASIRPLDEGDVAALTRAIARIDQPRLKAQLADGLAPIMNIAESRKWASTPALRGWQGLITSSVAAQGDGYREKLTDYLAGAMCRPRWSNGAVATGVARRAQGQLFRGDPVALYVRLKAEACVPGKSVPSRVMSGLASAADSARSN
ncbi:MAG: pentapeptide repeat-containing protein [Pseudomonadota bacterium]